MKACIITVGNEVLKGKTINTNAAEIGRMLFFAGYDVYRALTVQDARDEIGFAFRSFVSRCDVIISSGGLGPTFDDMTVSSFAEEFDLNLVRDQPTFDAIKKKSEKRGIKLNPEREKMAMIPEGATVIKNDVGSAPGIDIKIGSSRIFMLPGVPEEMRSMLDKVRESIKQSDSFYFENSIFVNNVYEASLAPYVKELMKKYGGSIYVKTHPTVTKEEGESILEVEISAKSSNLESARALVERALRDISETIRVMSSEKEKTQS